MENATKALLIAAAVLVAILIISLGLVIYNMAADTIGSVNLNAQEVQAHNEQFKRYEGEAQRGTVVNSMLGSVLNANLSQTDPARKVAVYSANDQAAYDVAQSMTSLSALTPVLSTSAATSASRVSTGSTYKIKCIMDETTGLVNAIVYVKN